MLWSVDGRESALVTGVTVEGTVISPCIIPFQVVTVQNCCELMSIFQMVGFLYGGSPL